MLAQARSVALIGVNAVPVEVDVSPGLPAFANPGRVSPMNTYPQPLPSPVDKAKSISIRKKPRDDFRGFLRMDFIERR